MKNKDDIYFMRLALEEAGLAYSKGEVPVGAVLIVDGTLVRAHNQREGQKDPAAHAEIIALREGSRVINNWRLTGATLYVTKEPCIMCAGAMINARLGRLVYGCSDSKGGAVESLYKILMDRRLNHQVGVVSGVLADECASILKRFFLLRRAEFNNE
ncbi:MAG: tRNA adenosine(34) deaminase TadA [Thermodesulfovibrionales bacterium]